MSHLKHRVYAIISSGVNNSNLAWIYILYSCQTHHRIFRMNDGLKIQLLQSKVFGKISEDK